METLRRLAVFFALFLGSGCAAVPTAPGERIHGMGKEVIPELVGTWKLVSFHSRNASGRTSYPFGKGAQGRITYEAGGRMAVQVTDARRPRFKANDAQVASEAELRAAFGGYTAYYGTYTANADEHTIVHHIEVALLPNWVGTHQTRHFDYDGKTLTLSGPLRLGGVEETVSLVWERLR